MTGYYATGVPDGTVPPSVAPAQVNENVRLKFFTYTAPTGAVAATDYIELCTLDVGDTPLGGTVKVSAIATGGILQLGKSGSVSAYAVDGAANALEVIAFPTRALGFGTPLTARTTLRLTLNTAGLAAATTLAGYVLFAKAGT